MRGIRFRYIHRRTNENRHTVNNTEKLKGVDIVILTSYEIFSLEWAKACCKLNPNVENKKRLADIQKIIREKQRCMNN